MKNTAALKNFATSSRAALIEQMLGRVKQVLDDPKAAVEYLHDVRALRDAVDENGVDWVAATAAYTWFNRLTAARFMDANGFSGPFKVVSPAAGSASAWPEILTRAQLGEFADEIPSNVQASVIDLLTGKRTSTDPDGEAYALLLSAVFAAWSKPMPEVFPAAVDWIRSLTPLNMLAPTSVRAVAVAEMDAEACQNVEVVGWLYQFYNAGWKEQVDKSKAKVDAANVAPKTQLFTPEYIVRYLVENSLGRLWMRSRPTSGLREHMACFLEPVSSPDYAGATVSSPEQIKLLDPACGSGHMLTYAFDLLYRIYEEEGYTPSSISQLILTHNLRGLEIDERAAQLASFSLAMKARGKDRRFFSRRGEDGRFVQPDIVRVGPLEFDELEVELIMGASAINVNAEATQLLRSFVNADILGSLIRTDPGAQDMFSAIPPYDEGVHKFDLTHEFEFNLSRKVHAFERQARALADNQYHVVVANPPYLGYREFSPALSLQMKQSFPDAYLDLCVAFISRAMDLTISGGHIAIVAQKAWLFQSTYADFRHHVLSTVSVDSLVELGARAFPQISGAKVDVAAFVLSAQAARGSLTVCVDTVAEKSATAKEDKLRLAAEGVSPCTLFDQRRAILMPGAAFVYWINDHVAKLFSEFAPLANRARVLSGISTGNDDVYFRQVWEVSRSKVNALGGDGWRFCSTGDELRRWSQAGTNIIQWGDSRESIAISSSGQVRNFDFQGVDGFGFRKNGGIFEVGLSSDQSVFDDTARRIIPISPEGSVFQAQLNSTSFRYLVEHLCRGTSFTSGELLAVPFPDPQDSGPGADIDTLANLFAVDAAEAETSFTFETNPLVAAGAGLLEGHTSSRWEDALAATKKASRLEEDNNRYFARLYELEGEVECEVSLDRISLTQNPYFRYAPTMDATRDDGEYRALFDLDLARDLVSYAVGCMMGRYSMDKPGPILADAGAAIADFDKKVPTARFEPDADGIIPITAERYFPDDIVARMEEFLAVAFGKENVEANVAWLESALGSGMRKSLRDYFLRDFYNDHLRTYSRRPIYWQVSSNPQTNKGFNALFYLHRYTPATLGIVRELYANHMTDKQQARLETIEHALLTAGKAEATKLSKERDLLTTQRREIRDWITNKLFPLSTAEVELNLDDGVKRNYVKLQEVLRKVTGL